MFTLQTIQIIGKAFSCAVGKCQYLHQVNLISFNFVENQLSPQSRGFAQTIEPIDRNDGALPPLCIVFYFENQRQLAT